VTSETAAERVPAGLTPERVGFFTDAVFAIAMTLLVIEIPRPEDAAEFIVGDGVSKAEAARNLLSFLYDQTGSFVAYLLAFFLLWIAWRQHHRLFDRIDRLSPRMITWHFPMLLLIGFLPYPTTVFGNHTDNPAAALLYVLGVGGLLFCRAGLLSQALRDGVPRDGTDLTAFRAEAQVSWIVTAYWIATVLVVWWTPWVIAAWLVSPVLGSILGRRNDRRASARLHAGNPP
jgi:uncharacterized membrane protein